MKYQPWLHSKNWEKQDLKFREISLQPCRLPHTKALSDSIDIKPEGILMVRGPRQVGKSTFLREFAHKCLKKGVKSSSLVIFDAESMEDRHVLLGEIEHFVKTTTGYRVILFDEITSVKNWWQSVKTAADHGILQDCLVVCTGSSSLDLAEGADLMPGRRGRRYPVDFELLPVPYPVVKKFITLEDYMLTGGFPWPVNEFLKIGAVPPYVYNVYASWIEGAFTRQRHSVQNLPFLLNKLIDYQCTPVSVTRLARDSGMGSNSTAETFLFLLENIYAVISCRWSDPGKPAPAPRKNRKFYPFDPFLFHLFSDFGSGWEYSFKASQERLKSPDTRGKMFQGLIASHLKTTKRRPLYYWKGKREIDFISDDFIEVKYQEKVSPEEFNWADKILPKSSTLTVITKKTRAHKGKIRLVPVPDWLEKI